MRAAARIGAALLTAALPLPAGWAGSRNIEDGLRGRTDILGFEDFESSSWGSGWGMSSTPEVLTETTVFKGSRSLCVKVNRGAHEGANFMLSLAAAGAADTEELYYRYYVYYAREWGIDDGRGQVGKMPGFYGSKSASGCGTSSGWSARGINEEQYDNMKVGFYVYDHIQSRNDNCGDGKYGSVLFPKERWVAVEGYIKLNTPGQANGVLKQWVDGKLNHSSSTWKFRLDSSSPKVKGVWFHVYVGGTWNAPRDMACYFDNLVIARNPIGLATGSSTPPPPAEIVEHGVGRCEAEEMSLTGYSIESQSSASGGRLIRLTGASGDARYIFTGRDGEYAVTVGYVDEDDGVGDFALKVNGTAIESWKGVSQSGSWQYTSQVSRSVALAPGDTIVVAGAKGDGEPARIDYVVIEEEEPTRAEQLSRVARGAPGAEARTYDIRGRRVPAAPTPRVCGTVRVSTVKGRVVVLQPL